MHEVAIIGAGLAGLTGARLLAESGARVTVIERNDEVGGRLATRRIGDAVFDHGAQFFTVRSDEFRDFVSELIAANVVTEWCRGFERIDGYPRYVCRQGMNQMANWLVEAATFDVLTTTTVTAVRATDEHWRVEHDRGFLEADSIIMTSPVPQTAALLRAGGLTLPTDLDAPLTGIDYRSTMALMAGLDRPSAVPSPGGVRQPEDPHFSFIGDNQAKGISPVPAVTFHTAPALTRELWDLSPETIVDDLIERARPWLGEARIEAVELERWRYTDPITTWPDPTITLFDRPGPAVLAGDAFGGAKVEGAFLSGRAAGHALLVPN
ncbi:MAG: NAD(P)-binding protein [Actinomycetia bacterium]|nr:NAD(P)-binding protein [Actinomycetes bacterium]